MNVLVERRGEIVAGGQIATLRIPAKSAIRSTPDLVQNDQLVGVIGKVELGIG